MASALLRVFHLVDPATALLRPGVLWSVVGIGSRNHIRAAASERRQRHAGVSPATVDNGN